MIKFLLKLIQGFFSFWNVGHISIYAQKLYLLILSKDTSECIYEYMIF